jgi:hypothetical protein
MRWCFVIIFAVLICSACSDNGSNPDGNTTASYDTLYATVSGEYHLDFATPAVNVNIYPQDDSSKGYLVSGTMPKGPLELYSLYFFIEDDGSGQTQFDLEGTGGMTRFVFNAGLAGETEYEFVVSGSVSLTKNTDKELEGNFSYEVANADSSKFVTIENGFFSFTREN